MKKKKIILDLISNHINNKGNKFLIKQNYFPNYKDKISIKNDQNKRKFSQENKSNATEKNKILKANDINLVSIVIE